MAILNRILTVLIVLLAITATVFSYLLFKRRHEFRDRAQMLSQSITQTVKTLDQKSNTGTPGEVTFTPADREAGEQEQGSLSWQAFHDAKDPEETGGLSDKYGDFDGTLGKAETLASKVHEQRNTLADKLYTVAQKLNTPKAIIERSRLKTLEKADDTYAYVEQADEVIRHAELLMSRDQDIFSKLQQTAKAMGESIDIESMKTRQKEAGLGEEAEPQYSAYQHSAPLDEFYNDVKALKSRHDSYRKTLVAAVTDRIKKFDWHVTQSQIKDRHDYENAMGRMKEDFTGLNGKLAELENKKQELADTKRDLESTKQKLQNKRQDMRELASLTEKLRKALISKGYRIPKHASAKSILRNSTKQVLAKGRKTRRPYVAHILKVNAEYGYVIIDAGRADVEKGDTLMVSRGGHHIADTVVTAVKKEYATADILPQGRKGEVRVGDRLIYPETGNDNASAEQG